MALTLSELQAMTDDYIYQRQPVDVYFKSNALLYKLLSRGNTYDGGLKIQANLEYGKSNTNTYGPKDELPVNKTEILTAAFFVYAAYFATLTIDMEDELQNIGSDQALVNLLQAKLNNAEKSIRDTMGAEIYNSKSTSITNAKAEGIKDPRPFIGLGDLFNTDPAVAYGEIKENDLSMWKANVISTAETMSFEFMQRLRRTASTDTTKEGKPDLYMTTETLQDAYERTLQPQVRYSNRDLLDAGFDNVMFKGAAVVADDNQSAGVIDALNTKYLDIKTHKKRNFTPPKWQSPIRQPDTATANIRWAGQLLCTNRKAHARANNVSEPS
jgi:hypothetical protein